MDFLFRSSFLTGTIEVRPAVTYSVHLVACTTGGCAQSADGTEATTEEARRFK